MIIFTVEFTLNKMYFLFLAFFFFFHLYLPRVENSPIDVVVKGRVNFSALYRDGKNQDVVLTVPVFPHILYKQLHQMILEVFPTSVIQWLKQREKQFWVTIRKFWAFDYAVF